MNDIRTFVKEIIKETQQEIKKEKPQIAQYIASVAQSVFSNEKINVIPLTDEKILLRITSSDKDFLNKEFGNDNYHPANRAIIFENMLKQKK